MDEYQQKLAKIREQNRLRAQKHYAKHRDEIKEKRKVSNALKKQNPVAIVEEPATDMHVENTDLLDKLNGLELNPNTAKKYKYDLKKVFELIGNANLIDYIREGKTLVQLIRDKDCPINTKRGLVQICLFLVTKFNIKVNKKALDLLTNFFDELKLISAEETEKKQNEEVPDWAEYLEKIKSKFGENSKMFLLATLYHEVTLRDDFGALKIVNKTPKETTGNYLIINKTFHSLLINEHKTFNKYGAIKQKLSKNLSAMISNYIANNNLTVGDYLFGNGGDLSDYIIYNNKIVGIDGGISLLRKMKVSQILSNPDTTAKDKLDLAKQMKHKITTQKQYKRKPKQVIESD